MKDRNKVVSIMTGWQGSKKGSSAHHAIIDLYNAHKPLARGYKVTYEDQWCATTVSAAFIQAGYPDLFPLECSCYYAIEGAKKMGIWQENDAYIPKPGDAVLYDWQDSGLGDCIGTPEHIGLVVSVEGNAINVIEGNKKNSAGVSSVEYRVLAVNGKYIRGFITPNFEDESSGTNEAPATTPAAPVAAVSNTSSPYIGKCTVELKTFLKGAEDNQVRSIQLLLSKLGYTGKDGKPLAIDGKLGDNTAHAIECFQRASGMQGINWGTVAGKTWQLLLSAK